MKETKTKKKEEKKSCYRGKCSDDHVNLATLVPTSLIYCTIFIAPQHVTACIRQSLELQLKFELEIMNSSCRVT